MEDKKKIAEETNFIKPKAAEPKPTFATQQEIRGDVIFSPDGCDYIEEYLHKDSKIQFIGRGRKKKIYPQSNNPIIDDNSGHLIVNLGKLLKLQKR